MLSKQIILSCVAVVLAVATVQARNPGSVSKDGWHTGERQNLDIDIAFHGAYGETVTDGEGTTYSYYGQSHHEAKVYPPEYWGVFPLYFFGTPVGITVSIENKSAVNTAHLSVGTECYVLKADASNGGTLLSPGSFYMDVEPGQTKTFDASFNAEYSDDLESGLDRFLVKIYEGTQANDGVIDFSIASSGVTPNEPFLAQLEILGSAISYGGQYDIPVTVQLALGDGTVEPFGGYASPVGGNVNDGNNPRVYQVTDTHPAGTLVSVSARSWVKKSSSYSGSKDSHWQEFLEVSSLENSDNFVILKNGDDVLGIPGYLDQQDLEVYLQDYVADGKIVLAPNQAIFLFELGTTNMGSSAADFQDLVVLLTMQEASVSGSGTGGQGELIMMREAVFCPPELEEGFVESLINVLP